jgi:hypothetical protein|tara:strand:+ start:153 stop:653 length:501 start_codon:yes stop_codon:yes gene_type:complete
MTQFEQDLEQDLSVNGKDSSKGMYNLIVSKRDLGLWKMGMKPNRHWKVTDVKRYFGLKGNKEKLYDDICKMVEEYTKLPTMTRKEFIQKYFMPELTEDEKMRVNLGFIDWKDSYLDECAKEIGVTIDHNADRDQCDGCNEYFEGDDMSYNDDNDNVECDTCYGTEY